MPAFMHNLTTDIPSDSCHSLQPKLTGVNDPTKFASIHWLGHTTNSEKAGSGNSTEFAQSGI